MCRTLFNRADLKTCPTQWVDVLCMLLTALTVWSG